MKTDIEGCQALPQYPGGVVLQVKRNEGAHCPTVGTVLAKHEKVLAVTYYDRVSIRRRDDLRFVPEKNKPIYLLPLSTLRLAGALHSMNHHIRIRLVQCLFNRQMFPDSRLKMKWFAFF